MERFGEALVKLWAGFGDDLGGFGETLGKLRGGNEEALGSFGEAFKAFQCPESQVGALPSAVMQLERAHVSLGILWVFRLGGVRVDKVPDCHRHHRAPRMVIAGISPTIGSGARRGDACARERLASVPKHQAPGALGKGSGVLGSGPKDGGVQGGQRRRCRREPRGSGGRMASCKKKQTIADCVSSGCTAVS